MSSILNVVLLQSCKYLLPHLILHIATFQVSLKCGMFTRMWYSSTHISVDITPLKTCHSEGWKLNVGLTVSFGKLPWLTFALLLTWMPNLSTCHRQQIYPGVIFIGLLTPGKDPVQWMEGEYRCCTTQYHTMQLHFLSHQEKLKTSGEIKEQKLRVVIKT